MRPSLHRHSRAMMRPIPAYVLLLLLLAVTIMSTTPTVVLARRHTISRTHLHGYHDQTGLNRVENANGAPPQAVDVKQRRAKDTLAMAAGSSLPDCSHACGSCFPCRLVMVSFVCASLQEAETCPVAYKCMCHRKSYRVP